HLALKRRGCQHCREFLMQKLDFNTKLFYGMGSVGGSISLNIRAFFQLFFSYECRRFKSQSCRDGTFNWKALGYF
ncbi:hypothetical protein V2H45_15220, partial [Tumidithrix elongata RA019]|nr:hypothetical protein [Tumidithrix elongata RA019]